MPQVIEPGAATNRAGLGPRLKVSLRTLLVTVAVHAHSVLALVEVVPAAFAVGAGAVPHAVQAVAAMAGLLVQVLVEVAATGKAVAVAGCDKQHTKNALVTFYKVLCSTMAERQPSCPKTQGTPISIFHFD